MQGHLPIYDLSLHTLTVRLSIHLWEDTLSSRSNPEIKADKAENFKAHTYVHSSRQSINVQMKYVDDDCMCRHLMKYFVQLLQALLSKLVPGTCHKFLLDVTIHMTYM